MRVLIVDVEPGRRRTLRSLFEAMGHAVDEAASGSGALRAIENRACDVAFVALRQRHGMVFDVISALHERRPSLAVVAVAAPEHIAAVVEAIRYGAAGHLPLSPSPEQVRTTLERVLAPRRAGDRIGDSEERVGDEVELDPADPPVARVWDQARRVASSAASVLIRGETGTGKGLLARSIHDWSRRAPGLFVTLSCPNLLESDLFGHARGAFTGAACDPTGEIAGAASGTLFLDEVGDMPPGLQPRLTRLLREHRYERVGEAVVRTADIRVIAATHHDLEAAVAAGTFRQDLLYRLNAIELTLPPLRRRSDLGALADGLLARFARRTGRPLTGFTPEAREALALYPWPGNLRELRNAIEHAAILAPGPMVDRADLPERITKPADGPEARIEVGRRVSLERIEIEHIRRVLASTSSLDEAALVLEIDASTLYRKRKKIGL